LKSLTKVNAELLVAVALRTAQPEVAVYGIDVVAELMEGTQKSHAIGATRQGHEVESTVTEKFMLLDITLDGFGKNHT
jgi:hypothetical protein